MYSSICIYFELKFVQGASLGSLVFETDFRGLTFEGNFRDVNYSAVMPEARGQGGALPPNIWQIT